MHSHKIAFSSLLLLLPLLLTSQSIDERIKELYDRDAYEDIRTLAETNPELSDTGLYIVGRAYYQIDENAKAKEYFVRATERNPNYSTAWFFRSQAGYFMKDSAEAFSCLHRAIAIDATRPMFWSWKGDLYYIWNELDSALLFYRHALTLPEPPERAFVQIGNVLSDMNRDNEAIDAFLLAKTKVDKSSDLYLECLFNTGSLGVRTGRLAEAEASIKEFLLLSPNEYRAISILIQIYYARKEYDKAEAIKPVLYTAWRNKKLPESMADDFCIDQFMWNDQRVLVYERFESSGMLYYKHVFYLLDAEGKTELTVQTESSAAVRHGDTHYVLGKDKGRKHFTYIQYTFPKNPDYDELKTAVIDVLDGKAKASSSSSH
ncbi:MAG TPA: hypothetical protein PKL15_07590 [Saprospiraceae bacterium]|nr:hypothetical protein [Saprospiraceae bacterium]HNM25275.1 hypothetical protein [Saprospiraceae bacterium]